MINDDTFTALATIWDGRTREVFAAQDRHMDRMNSIGEATDEGRLTQDEAKGLAQRSHRSYRRSCEATDAQLVQALAHELELWLLA